MDLIGSVHEGRSTSNWPRLCQHSRRRERCSIEGTVSHQGPGVELGGASVKPANRRAAASSSDRRQRAASRNGSDEDSEDYDDASV